MATNQKVFRVFVSSTFKDFKAERNVLQKYVFPELARRCQKNTARFLGVDLRWGISSERAASDRVLTTCFDEIKRCQRLTPKPNFLILLGDRYGWLPLPEKIPDSEYRVLYANLGAGVQQHLADPDGAICPVDAAYRKDTNDRPLRHDNGSSTKGVEEGVWILQGGQARSELREALAKASDYLPENRRVAYKGSATHQEISRGLLETEGARSHVLAWSRTVTDTDNKYHDDKGHELLDKLKSQVRQVLGNRCLDASVDDLGDLEGCEDIETLPAKAEDLPGYLLDFSKRITDALWKQIQIGMKEARQDESFVDAMARDVVGREEDIEAILAYCKTKSPSAPYLVKGRAGAGKTALMAAAAQAINAERDCNCLCHFAGDGGPGRIGNILRALCNDEFVEKRVSSICLDDLCRLLEDLEQPKEIEWGTIWINDYTDHHLKLDKHFKHDIDSICKQSKKIDNNSSILGAGELADAKRSLIDAIERFRDKLIAVICYGISKPRAFPWRAFLRLVGSLRAQHEHTVIFLDGIDEWVGGTDFINTLREAARCSHNAPDWPENVWLVAAYRADSDTSIPGLSEAAWKTITHKTLSQANRSLSNIQQAWVYGLRTSVKDRQGNPLVLQLALGLMLRLRSWDDPPVDVCDMDALLETWRKGIVAEDEHGILADRALAYLSATTYGLPEDALLELFAKDAEVVRWFNAQAAAAGQEGSWDLANGLPPILWSRLHGEVEPFLGSFQNTSGATLRWYHAGFADTLAKHLCIGQAEYLAIAHAAWNRLAGSTTAWDPDSWPDSVPADLYRHADAWAVNEVVAQLARAKPDVLAVMLNTPAFAMAVVSVDRGIRALIQVLPTVEAPVGSIPAIMQREIATLGRLTRSTERLAALLHFCTRTTAAPRTKTKVLRWLSDANCANAWIRDLAPSCALHAAYTLERCGYVVPLEDDNFALLSEHWSRTINASSPHKLKKYFILPGVLGGNDYENGGRWLDYGFKGLDIHDDDVISIHKYGPLRLWDTKGHLVAELVNDDYVFENRNLDVEWARFISPAKALVLYSQGVLALWDVGDINLDGNVTVTSRDHPEIFTILYDMDLPDGSNVNNVQTDIVYFNSESHHAEFMMWLANDGAKPVLVVYDEGKITSRPLSHPRHPPTGSISGPHGVAYVSDDCTGVVMATAASENLLQYAGRDRRKSPNTSMTPWCWSPSGDTLFAMVDFPSLVAFDMHSFGCKTEWEIPLASEDVALVEAGERKYLICRTRSSDPEASGGIVRLINLNDDRRPSIISLNSPLETVPEGCTAIDDEYFVGWHKCELLLVRPSTGEVSTCLIDGLIKKVYASKDRLLCEMNDGRLGVYLVKDVERNACAEDASPGVHRQFARYVGLVNGQPVTASKDVMLAWSIDKGSVEPRSLLSRSAVSKLGEIRCIRQVGAADAGMFITLGDNLGFLHCDEDTLKVEHVISAEQKGYRSFSCTSMVQYAGDDDLLFEWGSSDRVGRVKWGDVKKPPVVNMKVAPRESSDYVQHLVSSVLPGGWVIIDNFCDLRPSYVGYNVDTGQLVGSAGMSWDTKSSVGGPEAAEHDVWLTKLFDDDECTDWLKHAVDKRMEALHERFDSIVDEGGRDLAQWDSLVSRSSRMAGDDSGSDETGSQLVTRYDIGYTCVDMPLAIRENKMLESPSLRHIGIRTTSGEVVSYLPDRRLCIEKSFASEYGLVLARDADGRIHWLQLMRGGTPKSARDA